MLHITDGESVAGTLRESGIPGDVRVYGDLMYEGPAPAGVAAGTWREIRARFIAGTGFSTLEEAREYLKECDDALAAFNQHQEVVIWLDHKLSNQLMLIKALDWFSRQDLGGSKVSLISIGQYPGIDPFVGLGQLQANQLAALAKTRSPVNEAQYRIAQTAWRAFTSPDPTAIERVIQTDTSALPFLAVALRRHLEQFPSAENGLSRTERQALSVLHDRGPLSGSRLFFAVQRMETPPFMGDWSFYGMMAGLSESPHPFVQISDAPQHGLGDVRITETGRKALEGRADQVNLNGIDRWLGGVHLKGEKAAWRWDPALERIVSY